MSLLSSVLIGGAGTGLLALAACTSSGDTTTRPPTRTPKQEPAESSHPAVGSEATRCRIGSPSGSE